MPWCADCDRYFAPPALQRDGSCPSCGSAVEGAPVARAAATGTAAKDEALPPVPWHFKLMLAALAVYLGYRFFEIAEWLVDRL